MIPSTFAASGFEQVAGNIDINLELPTLAQLRQQAQLHPQILRWQDEQALGRARLDLAKAQARPDIAVTAGLKRLEQEDDSVSTLKDVVLKNARTVFEVARTGYEGGRFDYLHLLDAQRTLFNTEIQLLNAQISVRLALADLEYVVGQSLESILTESSNKGVEK